jgi:hypothetical protein
MNMFITSAIFVHNDHIQLYLPNYMLYSVVCKDVGNPNHCQYETTSTKAFTDTRNFHDIKRRNCLSTRK